jgi:hypothetical protein
MVFPAGLLQLTLTKAVDPNRVTYLEWRLTVAFNMEEVHSRLCVDYRSGMNALVIVLQLQFSMIDIFIERHFGFGVEPVVLNVLLDVLNGSDGGGEANANRFAESCAGRRGAAHDCSLPAHNDYAGKTDYRV